MNDPGTIVAHYVVPDSAEEFPLHGVFGGISPQGWVTASFFTERVAIPKEIHLSMTPVDGSPLSMPTEVGRHGKAGIIRTVTGTYYMNADMAESVGRWLIEQAEERRKIGG